MGTTDGEIKFVWWWSFYRWIAPNSIPFSLFCILVANSSSYHVMTYAISLSTSLHLFLHEKQTENVLNSKECKCAVTALLHSCTSNLFFLWILIFPLRKKGLIEVRHFQENGVKNRWQRCHVRKLKSKDGAGPLQEVFWMKIWLPFKTFEVSTKKMVYRL